MSGEVKFRGPSTGATCYFTIRGSGNSIWSTSGGVGGFEVFTSGDWSDYSISAIEQGVSNIFVGNFPAAVPAGEFDIEARRQTGGSPTQLDFGVAQGEVQWNGTGIVALANLASSGQIGAITPIRLARGTMIQNFPIYFKSAADHITPFTSGTVSGQIARDGGTFGPLQSGLFTETGQGYFNLQALTSGDLLANTVKILFTAVGISGGNADPVPFSFVLQRTSGQ